VYNTQFECLDALERGDIDLMIASDYALLTQTNYREKTGFKVNLVLNLPMTSNFGFSKSEAVLCSIIDKAQRFLSTNEIEINWTGRSFDYTKKLAEQRTRHLTIFLVIISCVLSVTIFVLIKNIKLTKVLNKIASHDALTGIFNRRYFLEQAKIQISRSLRLSKECFIILYDLDHFKRVNDTYGHSAGDTVLREIAQRIKKTIRPYDLFGRYGGEEFIMLMCDTDRENVINATERVRQVVCNKPVDHDGISIPTTASFGVACVHTEEELNEMIEFADEALYRAKNEGRNKVVYHFHDNK
jgi:diguanylate cyclase (GGDEF)-like protein